MHKLRIKPIVCLAFFFILLASCSSIKNLLLAWEYRSEYKDLHKTKPNEKPSQALEISNNISVSAEIQIENIGQGINGFHKESLEQLFDPKILKTNIRKKLPLSSKVKTKAISADTLPNRNKNQKGRINPYGKASLILGISAFAAAPTYFLTILSIPAAILAIVFGRKAMRESTDAKGKDFGRAGVILGITFLSLALLALTIAIIVTILIIFLVTRGMQ